MSDLELMHLAIAQAQAAERAGEVPVGAILLSPAGDLLSTGNNRVLRDSDPTAHAEMVALRRGGIALRNYRLTGCTLVCTLEPCAMCAGAMLHARIGRLLYAASDPKAGACGSILAILNHPQLNHRLEVSAGLLAEECSRLLSGFFINRRQSVAGVAHPTKQPE
jgi:tRNA(adenine34) deaminase